MKNLNTKKTSNKLFFIFAVIMFCITVILPNKIVAQNPAINTINAELRTLFTPLARPSSSLEFLWDMSAMESDSVFYQVACLDTNETDVWFKIYEEMYHASYDTSWLQIPANVYSNSNNFFSDTVPMGIMNFGFYKFIDSALTTDTYFNWDTVTNVLTDKMLRPGYPQLDSNMFCAAPLVSSSHFANPVFRVDPNFIYYDTLNSNSYTGYTGSLHFRPYILKIDFDDGNGWITFDPTVVTNHPVTYTTDGIKYIQTGVFYPSNTNPVYYSISRFKENSPNLSVAPDSVFSLPGINCYLYKGCRGTGIQGKTVIYLKGFDIGDQIPRHRRTISTIYQEMIKSNDIVELKNFGYDFLIVDWNSSQIDLRFNALYTVNLLEQLKCNMASDDNEMFVMMGESMGGLIGRYALTFMETRFYQTYIPNPYPFFVDAADANDAPYLATHPSILLLPTTFCHREKMHNTRLLITLDAPHQGANVPIAIQLAYNGALLLLSSIIHMDLNAITSSVNQGLAGKAAKQMLIYHASTQTGFYPNYSYTSHPDKDNFFLQLDLLGNYPQYAKVVAMSNGSLAGENQTNIYTNHARTPGDRLLEFNGEYYFKVLKWKVPLLSGTMGFYTNPNSFGHIFDADLNTYIPHIHLHFWHISLDWTPVSLMASTINAYAKPYCTSAGGNISEDLMPKDGSDTLQTMLGYTFSSAGGCVNFGVHFGLNGWFTDNISLSLCTDGTEFNFVPVQSALDYGTLGSIPLNHDIQSESINTKLGQVRASVIIGYPDTGIYKNQQHLNYRNVQIHNLNYPLDPTKYFYYTNHNCATDTVARSLLSLEIGDEQLFLENLTLPWHGDYQALYDIHVNDRNRYYEYPSQPYSGPPMIHGAYSKENPYHIGGSGLARFYTDSYDSPTHIGLNYTPPFSGTYQWIDQIQTICCHNFRYTRMINSFTSNTFLASSFFNIAPNPNNGNQLFIRYKFKEMGAVKIEIINLMSEIVFRKSLNVEDATVNTFSSIDLYNSNLPPSFYIVRITNGHENLTSKLIIN